MAGRESWNAARLASQRPLPKPLKMHGPVGEKKPGNEGRDRCRGPRNTSTWFMPGEVSACENCGYHVCGCEQIADQKKCWALWNQCRDSEETKPLAICRLSFHDGYTWKYDGARWQRSGRGHDWEQDLRDDEQRTREQLAAIPFPSQEAVHMTSSQAQVDLQRKYAEAIRHEAAERLRVMNMTRDERAQVKPRKRATFRAHFYDLMNPAD